MPCGGWRTRAGWVRRAPTTTSPPPRPPLRERRSGRLRGGQAAPQALQALRGEAGADLAREGEPPLALVDADEQRAQAHARALRVREAADHELLPQEALHLEPGARAARLV